MRSQGRERPPGVAAILAATLMVSGCSTQPHSVIVVAIDTLRADHLGCYGYARPTSPNLDRLAASGYVFDNAIAQSSWTSPSIGSLFTSTYPSVHGAHNFDSVLPASLETLATAFRRRGYQTAGISANFAFVNKAKGFGAGFDEFVELKRDAREGHDAAFDNIVPEVAASVTDAALGWLGQKRRAPLFLYLHYMDPHSSYWPPEPHRARFTAPGYSGPIDGTNAQLTRIALGEMKIGGEDRQRLIDLYDGEISYVDEQIGRLLQRLDASGLLDESYVIVLSDHGEEFLDHGHVRHGSTLYGELIRVPLIIRLPGGTREARRLPQLVQMIDVGPTILALTGQADPRPTQGRSFGHLLGRAAGAPWRDLAYSELFDLADKHPGPRVHDAAVTSERWSYLTRRTGGAELYDRQSDPAQTTNVEGGEKAAAADAARTLAEHVGTSVTFAKRVSIASDPLTPAQRESLRSLGYIR